MNNYLIIITAGSKLDVSIIELNFHVDKQIEIDGCTYTVKSSTDDISLGFIDWFYDHEHALVGIEIIPRDEHDEEFDILASQLENMSNVIHESEGIFTMWFSDKKNYIEQNSILQTFGFSGLIVKEDIPIGLVVDIDEILEEKGSLNLITI